MTDFGVQGDELPIDWDHLLDNIPYEVGFDLPVDPPANPDSGCSLSLDDIEKYLLDDDAFFCESPPKDSSSSPDSVEIQQDEGLQIGKTNVVGENVDDESDDPAAKKRKRKMRNRDAAVRSRERKKEYVKDLEMKSKYYEAECKRLGILLQNCLVENQALRFSLHNTKAFDTSMAKQESAVLLLELLLLGSLLGPLGIICLLILPSHLLSTLEKGLLGNVSVEEWGRLAPRKAGRDVFRMSLPKPFFMGKGCKASRPRFKDEAMMSNFCETCVFLIRFC